MDLSAILPLEIIEEIFCYLTGYDLLKCCKVCVSWKNIIESESFWKQMCLKRGYSSRDKNLFTSATTVDSWREYFWSNYNWRNKQYVCHKIHDDGGVEQAQFCGTCLVIPGRTRIRIWDIESEPKITQELEAMTCENMDFNLRVSNNYIVYDSGGIIIIYSKEDSQTFSLYRIVYFTRNFSEDTDVETDLIEEYFSVESAVHLSNRSVTLGHIFINLNEDKLTVAQGRTTLVWCLNTWRRFSVLLPNKKCVVYSARVYWPCLYAVTVMNREYYIKVYNLLNSAWVMNIPHCKQSQIDVGMVQPKLIINDRFIVTSSLCVRDPIDISVIYVSVWNNVDGKFISKITVPGWFFNTFFMDDLIILTSSVGCVTIWDPIENTKLKEFQLKDSGFSAVSIMVNKLLIASYPAFFDVWDLKTGTKLHRTYPSSIYSYNQRTNFLYYVQSDSSEPVVSLDCGRTKSLSIYNFREPKETPVSYNFIKNDEIVTMYINTKC